MPLGQKIVVFYSCQNLLNNAPDLEASKIPLKPNDLHPPPPGPFSNYLNEGLALKYCLVIFHNLTQRHKNPPQHAERL